MHFATDSVTRPPTLQATDGVVLIAGILANADLRYLPNEFSTYLTLQANEFTVLLKTAVSTLLRLVVHNVPPISSASSSVLHYLFTCTHNSHRNPSCEYLQRLLLTPQSQLHELFTRNKKSGDVERASGQVNLWPSPPEVSPTEAQQTLAATI